MYIEKKILAIIALSVTAIMLAIADIGQPTASANTVIKDRDYQLVTGLVGQGGDALYVLDNRVGLMAVFVYDQTVRSLRPRKFTAVANLFGNR